MRIWIQPNLIYPIVTSKLYLMWRRWILSALARETEREGGSVRRVTSSRNQSFTGFDKTDLHHSWTKGTHLFVCLSFNNGMYISTCVFYRFKRRGVCKESWYIIYWLYHWCHSNDNWLLWGDEIINLMNILLISVDSPLTVCVGIGLPTKNIEKKNHQSIKIYISDSRRESSW